MKKNVIFTALALFALLAFLVLSLVFLGGYGLLLNCFVVAGLLNF